jgi:hypothetical protein
MAENLQWSAEIRLLGMPVMLVSPFWAAVSRIRAGRIRGSRMYG